MPDNRAVVRSIPWPYKAMLAICSDLDETPDAESYFGLMKFLNTEEQTPCGKGVNLEVGNSIYFDMPENQFSYWNTDDNGREQIRTLIKSGHIDCLHSFGDHAFTRKHAERALNDLQKHGCKMKVWVDHAVAPTNFGADIMKGYGDIKGHQAYHADLTSEFGIEYMWIGRVTSVIGQDQPFSLGGIADWRHPLRSVDTLGREYLKHLLGRWGKDKYGMHSSNRLMRMVQLRNGMTMHEFIRSNPHWSGISGFDRGDCIHHVLVRGFIQRLIHRQGMCILYTHLGKVGSRFNERFLPEEAANAFELLSKYYNEKKLLVTTTRRLLEYVRVRDGLKVRFDSKNQELHLSSTLPVVKMLSDSVHPLMSGLSFENSKPVTMIKINDKQLSNKCYSVIQQESNKYIITFPWEKLKYPSL